LKTIFKIAVAPTLNGEWEITFYKFDNEISSSIRREFEWIKRKKSVFFIDEITKEPNLRGSNYLLNDCIFKEVMSFV
jgi:hypothetical protein